MPIQAPQWTEFLSCPICCHEFDGDQRGPISLGCGHTVCRGCLAKLQRNQCPYDQTVMRLELDQLPVNGALLSLVNHNEGSNGCTPQRSDGIDPLPQHPPPAVPLNHAIHYFTAIKSIKELALLLKPYAGSGFNGSNTSILSRPMQRKLVTLINCQLVEDEGRARAVRAARSLGERTVTELILHHQNHHQLSANLWAAVRSRGCQFLGPAMQEEVLKLVLLALEDGSALSRKVLVMFVVQRLEPHFPQASKTSIGHVVQLLYRASCFKVSKREGDSSLMQLKEEFRTYEALRREHDAQIVQIATEAGLRIAPDQWSSLLYGDTGHKSHMQSIIDKLQTPQSFGLSVQELVMSLQRTGDPGQLSSLRPPLELLAGLDPCPDSDVPGWESCSSAMEAVRTVVKGLVQFIQHHGNRKIAEAHHPHNAKYKTSMCRDLTQRGGCPRGNDCTFAHSEDELDKYRSRSRKHGKGLPSAIASSTGVSLNKVVHHNHHMSPKADPHHSSPPYPLPQQRNLSFGGGAHRYPTETKKLSPHPVSTSQPPPPMPSNSGFSLQTGHATPLPPPDVGRSVIKNGDQVVAPAPVLSIMGKHVMVEELIQPPPPSGPPPPYETAKFIQIPPHSTSLPVMAPPGPPPGNVIRTALAPPPTPTPTPIFAPPIADYAYGPFHHPPGAIFAQAGPAPSPAGLHHPAAAAGQPPAYSPQHPPPQLLPDLYPPSAQTLLMNQGHVYNLITPGTAPREFAQAGPIAETRQTNVIERSVVSSWPDTEEVPREMVSTCIGNSLVPHSVEVSACSVDALASKSLTELKMRKEKLLNQLENIVGKEAVDEVTSQIENGDLIPETSSSASPDSSSTYYSIWTSGANLPSWSEKSPEKNWDPSKGYRTYLAQAKQERKEDFIPFDPPIASRFGPISRMTRPFLPPTKPIQVSACSTTDPVTTPTVHRPVPAISPMPQVVYQHPGGFATFVQYPPPLDYMNTIGHGIIDPPQVQMSILEPTGSRPSDPIMETQPVDQEELQRQQFIAAKEGFDSLSFNQKFEEMRLKEELSKVMLGIQKKREIEKNQEPNNQEEDMTDFEQNWTFDFDETEKEEE